MCLCMRECLLVDSMCSLKTFRYMHFPCVQIIKEDIMVNASEMLSFDEVRYQLIPCFHYMATGERVRVFLKYDNTKAITPIDNGNN